jgi:hypothetical protein
MGGKRNFSHRKIIKEVLLKVVVQAIPTYTVSVFLLTKTLCKEINSMIARF